MNHIELILEHNQKFVANKSYLDFASSKLPDKKIAILSCMDTRLTKLLPAAMNLKNGDAKIIKNAGAVVSHPYGSVMRSLIVAIYELEVEDIIIVGHSNCGMEALNYDQVIEKIIKRGINPNTIDIIENSGIDLKHWLTGFDNPKDSILKTIAIIENHPLVTKDIRITGLLMCPDTGKLTTIKLPKLD